MQVNQLREAFSADVNRPFELKRGFPFESPSPSVGGLQPSPPLEHLPQPMLTRHESLGHRVQNVQSPYNPTPMTPPISSAGLSFDDSKDGLLMSGSVQMIGSSQQQTMPLQTTSMGIGQEWNPTPIFAYVIGARKLEFMLTEVIASGTMHLGRRRIRLHQPISCRNSHLLCILHQPLLNNFTLSTRSRRLIQRKRACQLCPGIRQHRNYLPTRLLQRLPSSHQACGETPSLAHMIRQEINDAGIWKRTGHSKWIIQFRRSGQGRPGMTQNSTNLFLCQPSWTARLYDYQGIGPSLSALFYELTKFRIHVSHAVTIARDDLRHSLWLHNCIPFSHIFVCLIFSYLPLSL